jgi:hypothetical protein
MAEFSGEVQKVYQDYETGKYQVVLSINESMSVINELINHLTNKTKIRVSIKKWREKRSLDANGLLWHCLGQIAESLHTDKWEVYLLMLKRYGKYTYICVKPHMVEQMKKQWRECEVVGEVDINGQKAVQMLCYFGSSTYDTKEFSVLLDGVISEMKEMGLDVPLSKDMQRALEQWEKMQK